MKIYKITSRQWNDIKETPEQLKRRIHSIARDSLTGLGQNISPFVLIQSTLLEDQVIVHFIALSPTLEMTQQLPKALKVLKSDFTKDYINSIIIRNNQIIKEFINGEKSTSLEKTIESIVKKPVKVKGYLADLLK